MYLARWGERGRNSDNSLIREKLNWSPSQPLRKGLEKTYEWISEQALIRANLKLRAKGGILEN
jgi:nucleoside-diphosphate-sugar epimerase